MTIRGWVYVISNAAMPGILKIGFSLKDPALRASDLANTGSPYPYIVEYEALVENPKEVEQRAHLGLAAQREGKEWFRCTLTQAISSIKAVAEGRVLLEKRFSETEEPAIQGPSTTSDLPSAGQSTYRALGTYGGVCTHCGNHFSTTLHPSDTEVKCPECFRQSNVSAFKRRELII